LNRKMTCIADEIGNSIIQYYDKEYVNLLFSNDLSIEDVIFQILVECCRYAYLKNAQRHPIKHYIERGELGLDSERKRIKRVIDYINSHSEKERDALLKSIGVEILLPETKLVPQKNRYPSYELSEFQYWELNNIYNMDLVKSVIEKRIGSSKKVSVERFTDMANQYDDIISKLIASRWKSSEEMVFCSLVVFTLETKYSFDFFYEIATEMDRMGKSEIPDMYNRLMAMTGNYKSTACLPDICPALAHDNDRFIEYPMIIQRQRYINDIINIPKESVDEYKFARIIEANVLANAVQSHIRFNGKTMRAWFAEETDVDDWASVFQTYNVFRVFVKDKAWSPDRIRAVRKMYDAVSLDYKSLS